MHQTEQAYEAALIFVTLNYRRVAAYHGVQGREFRDWADSMAGLAVAEALNQLHKYDHKRGSFRNFAAHQAKSIVRSDLRRRARHQKAKEALELMPPAPLCDDSIAPYLSRDEALQLLRMLNPEQSSAIALYVDGHEIAEIIGAETPNAVYARMRRGRDKARQLLNEFRTGVSSTRRRRARGRPRDNPDDYRSFEPFKVPSEREYHERD